MTKTAITKKTAHENGIVVRQGAGALPHIQRYLAGPWSPHLPFACDLIAQLNPAIFVELGVYKGESYFAFCQSVEEHRLKTQCYGIDTWRGDIHAGRYGREVGREVNTYNTRYSSFSRLLTMTFNEALSQFPDGSIDLLHIDGAHRYEDVKQDFENWRPKLSRKAIVLFHDVMVRERDFGVFRLWEEIARPRAHFLFEFGYGLGVWRATPPSRKEPYFLRKLFLANEKGKRSVQADYALKAAAVKLWVQTEGGVVDPQSHPPQAKVFAPRDGAEREDASNTAEVVPDEWGRVSIDLPWGIGDGSAPLRFDPVDRPGVIDIAAISLRSAATSEIAWRASTRGGWDELRTSGTCVRLPHRRLLRLWSYENDPRIHLPTLTGALFEEPFVLEAWMRFDPSPRASESAVKALNAAIVQLCEPAPVEPALAEPIPAEVASEPAESPVVDLVSSDRRMANAASLTIYSAGHSGYSEDLALEIPYQVQRWSHLHIALEHGLGVKQLRLDPLKAPGLVDIAGVTIKSAVGGDVLWRANGRGGLESLAVGGSAIRIPHPRLARIFSYGEDPQIHFPSIVGPEFDGPLQLEIWLKVETRAEAIHEVMSEMSRSSARALTQIKETRGLLEETARKYSDRDAEIQSLQEELGAAKREHAEALARIEALASTQQTTLRESAAADEKATRLWAELEDAFAQLASRDQELASRSSELDETRAQLASRDQELASRSSELDQARQQTAAAEEMSTLRTSELDQARREIASLNELVASRTSELGEALQQLTLRAAEVEQTQESLTSAREHLSARSAELEQTYHALASVKMELEQRGAAVDSGRQELASAKNELSLRVGELGRAREELAKLEGQLLSRNEEVDQTYRELKRVSGELESERLEIDQVRAELALARNEMDFVRAELAASSHETQATKSELDSRNSELAESRELVMASNAQLGAKTREIQLVQAELAGATEELSSIADELAAWKRRFVNQEKKMAERTDELARQSWLERVTQTFRRTTPSSD